MADINGKARSNDEIKASMAQTFTTPMDFHDMIDRTERYNAANEIIFTEDSLLVKRIRSLVQSLRDHSIQIRACGDLDKEYFTKILYAIDLRVNLWLVECMECEAREDVNDDLINFRSLIGQIALREFRLDLPPCFKMIDNSEKKRSGDNLRPSGPNGDRLKDDKRQKSRQMVRNENQFDLFKLKENENYRNTFTGKEKAFKRPLFDKKQICPKWNIQGFCFEDCNMKESHIAHSDYSQAQKDSFRDWMKFCRDSKGTS
jgi:hypothetical protein